MLETPEELERLQALLDASMASAGPHLRGIISDERRLGAAELVERLAGDAPARAGHRHGGRAAPGRPGRRLLPARHVLVQLGPRLGPHAAPGAPARRERHPPARRGARRDGARHGRSSSPSTTRAFGELRQAMLDEYLPKQGPSFETWLDDADAVGARIVPEKMFTFHLAREDAARLTRAARWPAVGVEPREGRGASGERSAPDSCSATRRPPRWRRPAAPGATCGSPPCSCGSRPGRRPCRSA